MPTGYTLIIFIQNWQKNTQVNNENTRNMYEIINVNNKSSKNLSQDVIPI